MDLFRCSKCRFIQDLSGEGAFRYGGRWNSKGVRMIYSASNPSLALLETLVHTVSLVPEIEYCMLKLETHVDSVLTKEVNELPSDWSASPAPDHLKSIGDAFIHDGTFLLLKVPSAILSMEWNYLINPGHPLFPKIKVHPVHKLSMDHRLIGQNKH